MKAIVLNSFGDVSQLVYTDIPVPDIKDNEVLVRISAIGINPVDVKTRKGKGQAARLKDDPPMILGWDISGEVVKTGAAVTHFKSGDEVFGMVNIPGHGKAYAEYVASPAEHLTFKPANISHEEAAGAGIAAMTAYKAFEHYAHLQKGQSILIHAAAGGVGHFAVQLAKAAGAYVIGTSSSENREFVLSLGADTHIDYKAAPFEETVPPVDVVLDAIGGDHIDRSLNVLKPGGLVISLPSGVSEDVADKAAAQGKRGVFFLIRSEQHDIRKIAELLREGVIRTQVSKVFPFDEIKQAHEAVESGKTRGKIVMRGPGL